MTGDAGPHWPRHHSTHILLVLRISRAHMCSTVFAKGTSTSHPSPLVPHIAHGLHTRGQALHAAAGASGQIHGRSATAAAMVLWLTSCRQKERMPALVCRSGRGGPIWSIRIVQCKQRVRGLFLSAHLSPPAPRHR